tara:strand:- start:34 stop:1050 length:1017 start_codon:yes stop_codon:yes gene_type:complete
MAYITFQPKDNFNTVAWTGTSSSPLNVTGFGFQPDWVWNKYRAGAGDHQVYDVVRGATKMIIPNSSAAESTNANGVTAFITDGYTVGSDLNVNGGASVGWGWKAANSQGSSNTDGSINTTYTSANPTAGFSISKFTVTGSTATVGHGLGVAPRWILVKTLAGTGAWQMYHASIGPTKYAEFHTNAFATSSGRWNDTAPTSSVFTISNEWSNGKVLVAYCFAEKKGFSKFNTFKGNNSADGSFVYTGFKPGFVLLKRNDSGYSWAIVDSKRSTTGSNLTDKYLIPDTNAADQSASVDLLSNGFKLRSQAGGFNASATYVYMAFAEEPLVSSNNMPATAR